MNKSYSKVDLGLDLETRTLNYILTNLPYITDTQFADPVTLMLLLNYLP